MPQNRDDNARDAWEGSPANGREDRNAPRVESPAAYPGAQRPFAADYAEFLRLAYGPRQGLMEPLLAAADEIRRQNEHLSQLSAEGPPTGEDTHTLEGDPRPEEPEPRERPTNFDGSEIE
jgi:hypothetical protein